MKLSHADGDWDLNYEQWLECQLEGYECKRFKPSRQVQRFNQRDKQRVDLGWSWAVQIEETAEKQDAEHKSSDERRKETREGCKGDSAWLEWSVNWIMIKMCLYISSTYLLVCTKRRWKVERRHTSDVGLWQMKLGVLNEYMVVHKKTNAAWLPWTVHGVQPVHTST